MTVSPVDCQQVEDESLAELYVARRLEGEIREAFEAHYMGCAACFDRVTVLCAVRSVLNDGGAQSATAAVARSRPMFDWHRWGAAAALAASLVVAAWTLSRMAVRVSPPRVVATTGSSATTSRPPAEDPLATLNGFEPPSYRASVLRGREDAATRSFRAAMELYQQGRFGDAVPGLTSAATTRGDAAYFLAACRLLTGDAVGAAEAAQRAMAFGDTPYLEDSRLLLAKALLRLHDRDGAIRELETVAAMHGERGLEASDLLGKLRASR